MTLHKITEFYTEWFSVCPNITSKFRNTAVFKSFVKCNNDSNKTCRYARDSFYVPNLICLSATVREIFKKGNFMYQVPSKFVFLVSHKNDLIRSCSSFEDLSAYTILLSCVHWFKFCIRLNVRHFGMVEDTGLM
jgi:hypothetical protein